jgi:hypothetical protein
MDEAYLNAKVLLLLLAMSEFKVVVENFYAEA